MLAATLPTGATPGPLACGDLDNDGRSDLVVGNAGSASVSVYLGQAGGVLLPAGAFAVGFAPVALALGKFDRDAVDLVVAHIGDNTLRLFRGNGDGSFGLADSLVVSADSTRPRGLAVLRFDGDAHLDVAVLSGEGSTGPGVLRVFGGSGDGRLLSPPLATLATRTPALSGLSLASDDVDGDGHADLVGGVLTGGGLFVARGNGVGGWIGTWEVATGSVSSAVALARLNADAVPDLIGSNLLQDTLSVRLGRNGLPPAAPTPSEVATGTQPGGVASGDLDGDGHLDLVVCNGAGSSVTVLRGRGDGTFLPGLTVPVGGGPTGIVVADFDQDGLADVAVACSELAGLRILLSRRE